MIVLVLRFFYWMSELFRQCNIYFFILLYVMKKKPAELQLLKKIWLWSSSVIKIVKMKYNRIDIKWWHVSTSFKIYLGMLSNLYITFTIFYYNTISLKRTQEEKILFFGSVSGCTCLILTISVSRKKIYNQQLGSYEKKTILDEVVFIFISMLYNCYVPTYHGFLRQRLLLKHQNVI